MMRYSEYIAACTRARAMKWRILSRDDWARIIMMNSAEEIINFLKQKGLILSTSPSIEIAEKELREGEIYAASSLIRFIHGPAYDALKYFIFYYDLLNIETIIYHLHSGTENKELAGILYSTGRQGMVRAELLAGVTSFPALANTLRGTVLYKTFKDNLAEYEREGDITSFIAGIELEFMRNWHNAVKRCAGNNYSSSNSSFDSFIKVKAADAMLRMQFYRDTSPHKLDTWAALVSGGLTRSALKEWREISDEQAASVNLIKMIFPRYFKSDMVIDNYPAADRQMMRALRYTVVRSQQRNEFSLDYLISFLLLVMLQTEDLIKTLECKDFGLNSEELTGYLIKEL